MDTSKSGAQLDPYVERRPTPDPTALTLEMIRENSAQMRTEFQRDLNAIRETIASRQEITEAKLEGAINSIVARLDAMDRALALIQSASDRLPSEVDLKLAQLKALHEEKFESMMTMDAARSEAISTLRASERTRLEGHELSHTREHQMQQEAVSKTERTLRETIESMDRQTGQQFEAIREGYRERAQYLETAINKAEQFVQARFREMEGAISASTEKSASSVAALRAELLPQITGERTRGDRGEGRQLGQGAMIGIIFGGLGALGVLVSMVMLVLRSVPK